MLVATVEHAGTSGRGIRDSGRGMRRGGRGRGGRGSGRGGPVVAVAVTANVQNEPSVHQGISDGGKRDDCINFASLTVKIRWIFSVAHSGRGRSRRGDDRRNAGCNRLGASRQFVSLVPLGVVAR